jgi:AraC-like DNA-binding protein
MLSSAEMSYQKITPCKRLAPYVERIWVQESACETDVAICRPTKVIPAAKVDVIFHYKDPFVQITDGRPQLMPRSHLIGQRTRPIEVAATGQTGIIIVSFYPWGVAPFFNFSLDECADLTVGLKLIFKASQIAAIENSLAEAESTGERIKIIQDFFVRRLDENRGDALTTEAVWRINAAQGSRPITALAKTLHISRRHFIRRFKQTIGLAPKQFSNVIRFQKALYYKRMGWDWPDITIRCGYYDQAHFIKEFKLFSGTSPQNILTKTPPTRLAQYFNSHRDLSHFYNTVYL